MKIFWIFNFTGFNLINAYAKRNMTKIKSGTCLINNFENGRLLVYNAIFINILIKNSKIGHITVGIGYDTKNKSLIEHDPYGDWRTNYSNQSGKEVEYPFGPLYIKDDNKQTMWLTHKRKYEEN